MVHLLLILTTITTAATVREKEDGKVIESVVTPSYTVFSDSQLSIVYIILVLYPSVLMVFSHSERNSIVTGRGFEV